MAKTKKGKRLVNPLKGLKLRVPSFSQLQGNPDRGTYMTRKDMVELAEIWGIEDIDQKNKVQLMLELRDIILKKNAAWKRENIKKYGEE